MDNVIRRRSSALRETAHASIEEPPSPWAFGPTMTSQAPTWIQYLLDRTHSTLRLTKLWVYRTRRWATANRDTALRLAAHGIVLLSITVTLGLSHVRLADVRLPSLAAPTANTQLARVVVEASVPSDTETYLQKALVPRTASAITIRTSPTDAVTANPRDDLLTPPSRIVEPTKPGEPAPEPPTLDSLTQTYVVEQGDTLLGISYKFDISLEALVTANPSLKGSLDTIFHPGWEFTIPPRGGILHIVKDGETLASISEKYKVKLEDIVSYGPNRLKAESELTPEQRVFVPEGNVNIPQPAQRRPNTLASVLQPRAPANTGSQASAAPIAATGTLRTPLYGYVITQYFWAYHNGVDLAAPIGTPVYAADAGRVIYAGWDNTGYGYMLLIDHGNGYRTRYAHLSWYFPNYGDYVGKGENIGKVGSTGRSSGPHLHFEVIVGGIARNPFNYIR